MGEEMPDAKTQPIQDGTNPKFSNGMGADGTELGMNTREKQAYIPKLVAEELKLCTQKNNELLGYLKSRDLEELANQEIREDALDYI